MPETQATETRTYYVTKRMKWRSATHEGEVDKVLAEGLTAEEVEARYGNRDDVYVWEE